METDACFLGVDDWTVLDRKRDHVQIQNKIYGFDIGVYIWKNMQLNSEMFRKYIN